MATGMMVSFPAKSQAKLETGIGHNPKTEETRTRAVFSYQMPLYEKLSISQSAGISESSQQLVLEEFGTRLQYKKENLSLGITGYKSLHFGVREYCVGGSAGYSIQDWTLVGGTSYIFDKGQIPVFAGFKLNSQISPFLTVGHAANGDAVTISHGFSIKVSEGIEFRAETFNIFNQDGIIFFDTIVSSVLRF